MDALCDSETRMVVWMKSAQVGATEILNNLAGYFMAHQPAPMLVMQPTLDMGKAWSKDRLAPMLRDTPCLSGMVGAKRSKDSDNTILHKTFRGGHLTIAGANSAASLASRPIRILLADEVDRYPASAGTEGDPLNLAMKRTTTFWNRKIYVCSTPTVKGQSRIEQAFEESNQQYYYVPCPHCGEYQRLVWGHVKWREDKPEEAQYCCEHCGALIEHKHKREMLDKGEWRATAESNGVAGFHISEIYSPWVTWGEMASNFLEAKKMPETLKTFVNTSFGETWEEDAERFEPHELLERAESYDMPEGVLVLTCAVDVQDDRLEAQVTGWGVEHESWVIDHSVWYGDPSRKELWDRLDKYLLQTWGDPPKRIACTLIDSGGHHTDDVYRFCKARQSRRVFAIKGKAGTREIISRPSKSNRARVNLFTVGVDRCKDLIFWRLKIKRPGAGYMHFCDTLDQEYFEQLTAEERREKHVQGRKVSYYHQTRKRNEALDLTVYNIAAVELLNPDFKGLARPPEETPPPPKRSPLVPMRRPNNFVTGWK
jgi:phage terminase large subunit GpA-like protein